MTRQPHDNFAKEYLEELLIQLGKVEKSKEILGEVRQIDIWFIPHKQKTENTNLGILAKMAAQPTLFEPYRNAITESEIKDCLLKLLVMENELERKVKREKTIILEAERPFLWILTPTLSERILNNFGAKIGDNWDEGVYFLPHSLQTGIIVINQLPKTRDTLLLRVLGRGKTQGEAVQELVNLAEKTPAQNNLLEVIASWQKNLELRQLKRQLTSEEKEDYMNLSPAYLKQREEWKIEGLKEGLIEGLTEGLKQGLTEGKREVAINLLKQNFEISLIVKVTGLSEETVTKLQQELG